MIRTGGKQYRVQPDQTLDVDRMPVEAGSTVEFRDVLLVDDGGDLQVGNPLVEGARVVAKVMEFGRDKKILVFKYKNKTRYRRRHGHRQGYMRLAIRQILTHGRETAEVQEEKPTRAPRQRRAPRKKAEQPQIEAVTAPPAEAAADVVTTAPRRASRARKTAQPATDAKAEPAGGENAKAARRPRATKKSESGE